MDQFPSNSRESKITTTPPESPTEKNILKLVDTPVIRRKQTLGSRLRELLFDGNHVFDYVVQEVLVPAFKDTVSDAVSTAMERLVFGENSDRPRRSRSSNRPSVFGGGPGHTNYNRYSSQPTVPNNVRTLPRRVREQNDFDDIIIATRLEAQRILDQMDKLIAKYGQVSVRDLYEMVGEQFHHTDNLFGWTDLSRAGMSRVSNGYLLNLPKTEALEE